MGNGTDKGWGVNTSVYTSNILPIPLRETNWMRRWPYLPITGLFCRIHNYQYHLISFNPRAIRGSYCCMGN